MGIFTWWAEITNGWNWQTVWSGVSVMVNLILGLVAYFAFKASRDAARFARIQAEAAQNQLSLTQTDSERVRNEYNESQKPKIAAYIKLKWDSADQPYYSIYIINVSSHNIMFNGISGKLRNFNGTETHLNHHEYRELYMSKNESPLAISFSEYWLADFPSKYKFRGRSDFTVNYQVYLTYLDSRRATYLWEFEIMTVSAAETFVSTDELKEINLSSET
ncbi:hypothetical protein [Deinococcus kurensis]|uniref:hypothetical protein n=1 Tax=Deinococcus kurensis TaxID=2662757 RepID=UPI0012D2C519|nr:hypothetical protein [Deinococcus kurensis]